MNHLLVWPRLAAIALFFACLLPGQAPIGNISGVVKDPSGAVVAEAQVKATSTGTAATRTTTTNSEGYFLLSTLQPGVYKLQVSAAGFGPATVERVTVEVGQTPHLEIPLNLTTASTQVEVAAGAVQVDTEHTTVGGVVTAGDAIMMVVPDADSLTVEAKVNPQDIDQVKDGLTALLRLSAFNQRTTPEIYGTVTRISADASTDQRTGQTYFTVRIAMPAEQVAKLGEVKIVPGMPVEAFIQTGERTMISYLAKPLHDQLMRMFREK